MALTLLSIEPREFENNKNDNHSYQSFSYLFFCVCIINSKLSLVIVKVLTYQALHVQSAARKHSLKVHRTQSHWHLSLIRVVHSHVRPIKLRWVVLRLVHHWCWLNSLFLRDLLKLTKNYPSIEVQQSWQFLYHCCTVSWLSVQDVTCKLEFLQVWEFSKFLNIVEFSNLVRICKQVLKSQQFLNVNEVLKSIVINFQTLNW